LLHIFFSKIIHTSRSRPVTKTFSTQKPYTKLILLQWEAFSCLFYKSANFRKSLPSIEFTINQIVQRRPSKPPALSQLALWAERARRRKHAAEPDEKPNTRERGRGARRWWRKRTPYVCSTFGWGVCCAKGSIGGRHGSTGTNQPTLAQYHQLIRHTQGDTGPPRFHMGRESRFCPRIPKGRQ
jgi:hypothetical protein